jgi:hypothetical protein
VGSSALFELQEEERTWSSERACTCDMMGGGYVLETGVWLQRPWESQSVMQEVELWELRLVS